MKILFITADNIFGTASSNIRNVSLINGLCQEGHCVDILTFEVNKDAKKFDSNIEKKLENCKFFFLKNKSLQKAFSLKKNVSKSNEKESIKDKVKLFFYRKIKAFYLNYIAVDTLIDAVNKVNLKDFPDNTYDIIISSSDPIASHKLAEKYMKAKGERKWYQYWGDPLYYDITRQTKKRSKLKKIEQGYLSKAYKVVYTNPMAMEEQMELFPEQKNKLFYVPTPFAFAVAKNDEREYEYDYGYFGSYMKCVRNILPLCESARKNGKKLLIVGGGDQNIDVDENVKTMPFQPINVVTELEGKCRTLVCLCNQSTNNQKCIQIPGKIFHYAMTNNSILVIGADERTKEFLSKYNRFIFSDNSLLALNRIMVEKEEQSEIKNSPIKQWECNAVARRFLSE